MYIARIPLTKTQARTNSDQLPPSNPNSTQKPTPITLTIATDEAEAFFLATTITKCTLVTNTFCGFMCGLWQLEVVVQPSNPWLTFVGFAAFGC